jgi:hypothetical protein
MRGSGRMVWGSGVQIPNFIGRLGAIERCGNDSHRSAWLGILDLASLRQFAAAA